MRQGDLTFIIPNPNEGDINIDEWEDLILEEIIDKTELIGKGCQFLSLTYEHSAKTLPKAIAEVLIQLPGGETWFYRK